METDPESEERDDEEVSLSDTEADLTMLQEGVVEEWSDDGSDATADEEQPDD